MPTQTKKRPRHTSHRPKEPRTKRFMKIYAPYIPLLLVVVTGLFLSFQGSLKTNYQEVLGYATGVTENGLLSETNKKRSADRLPALTPNALLTQAAQAKAEDMAKRNYWSHQTPDGMQPWTFIEKSGYNYARAAENLAYGFTTSDTTVSGWMNSESHRANILDNGLSEVGFGVVNASDYQNKGPQTIIVAMYGLPSGDPAQIPAANAITPSVLAESSSVSFAQALTGGSAPWISFAIGLSIGGILMYLVVKHSRKLRRTIKRGERFVIHHPLMDATLIAVVLVGTLLVQTAGFIH